MNENLFKANYDLTKKNRLIKFYQSNKILIFACLFFLIIAFISYGFYSGLKEKSHTRLGNNYIKAKIYLKNDEKDKAVNLLKDIVLEDNSTYSTLSLFLLLNENLINDQDEILNLFNHVLKNNKFEKEIKNLIIYKKALYQSNFINESELLESLKPLISTDTIWKSHALLLLGDYFVDKKEYIKAKEFYLQILNAKGLHKNFYNHARAQLILISND